ncbi:hypothetical protein Tco_0019807, partial [Tanacetum coccineum]
EDLYDELLEESGDMEVISAEEFDKLVKQTKTTKRLKDDEAKDAEPAKKSGKRRKQMARKGLHTDLDKDDSEEDELEKVFWKYLKNMFEEPLSTDPIWSLLSQQRIIRLTTGRDEWLTGKETSNPFKIFNDSPLTGVNTPGSDENRLKLYDLMYIIVNVADMMDC